MDEELFLGGNEEKGRSAKWNLFRFQDHLLNWVSISADNWLSRDYPSCFESLTIVYTDAWGFFDPEEQKEIDELFKTALDKNNNYINYNINFEQKKRQIKEHRYNPPNDVYEALLNFRRKLLALMTKHELTIPMVKKGTAGAGSA